MVKIKFKDNFEDELYISEDIRDDYKISNNKMSVFFGQWNKEMKVITDEKLPVGTIELSKGLEERFTIPTQLSYELITTEDKLIIGPVIAYAVKKRKESLTRKSLRKHKNRFKNYQNINGLIYVCAADGIDINNKTIEGFYYNPNASNVKKRWIYGTFPYPGAMYKKVNLLESEQKDLEDTMGKRIFNSTFFSKWKLYKTLSSNQTTKEVVPETRLFRDFSNIEEMLEKHHTVYMKPLAGMQGKGIFVVSKTKIGIRVVDRNKKKHHFKSLKNAKKFISKYTNKKQYLLQQAIPTTGKEQHVDFRLYMQKNSLKEWTCQGIVGRFAKKNSIITNLKFVDYLLPGHDSIKKLLSIDDKEAKEMTEQMILVGIETCKIIDKKLGHYGDVAVDMIVDQNRNLWILEINNRTYGMKSLKIMKDDKTFIKVKTTPFEYAKALAGFSSRSRGEV